MDDNGQGSSRVHHKVGTRFVYRTMGPEDEVAVKDFLYENFYGKEPLSKALDMEVPRECKCVTESLVSQAIADGLSAIAVERDTGQIVGAVLAVVTSPNNPKGYVLPDNDENVKKCKIIVSVLEKLFTGFDIYSEYNVPCAVEFRRGTTKQGYERHKIVTTLGKYVEEMIRKRAITVVYTTTTGTPARKVAERQGYSVISEINYSDFLYGGKQVFFDMGENKSCCLLAKRIKLDQKLSKL